VIIREYLGWDIAEFHKTFDMHSGNGE